MKTIIMAIGLVVTTSDLSQNSVEMEAEKSEVQQVVTQLFVSTDNRNWSGVERCFAPEVLLDYTSMAGGEPMLLTPQEITTNWKRVLPGFDATHHTISNFQIDIDSVQATVGHYGTADHVIRVNEENQLWTVVGTYDHHLIRTPDGWRIDKMTFHLKYMTGNMDLPRLAQESLESNTK